MRHPRETGLQYATIYDDLGNLAWDILTTLSSKMRFWNSSGPSRVRHPRYSGIPDVLT